MTTADDQTIEDPRARARAIASLNEVVNELAQRVGAKHPEDRLLAEVAVVATVQAQFDHRAGRNGITAKTMNRYLRMLLDGEDPYIVIYRLHTKAHWRGRARAHFELG